jgi:hypothetical protein
MAVEQAVTLAAMVHSSPSIQARSAVVGGASGGRGTAPCERERNRQDNLSRNLQLHTHTHTHTPKRAVGARKERAQYKKLGALGFSSKSDNVIYKVKDVYVKMVAENPSKKAQKVVAGKSTEEEAANCLKMLKRKDSRRKKA